MRRLFLAAIMLAIPAHGFAEGNGIKLDDAWSRAAVAGRIGVVYLTITDTGGPDRLTAVASPVAASAGLHESYDDHGVAKMRSVAALPVEPGKPVSLAPGGYHIMLTGLKQPLHQGDEFPVTLIFEKVGPVTTTVTVRKAGGSMPMGHETMGGMQMHDMPMQGGQRQ
jgi:periplasmic copper chaperone A